MLQINLWIEGIVWGLGRSDMLQSVVVVLSDALCPLSILQLLHTATQLVQQTLDDWQGLQNDITFDLDCRRRCV